jgi:hypothetical protein
MKIVVFSQFARSILIVCLQAPSRGPCPDGWRRSDSGPAGIDLPGPSLESLQASSTSAKIFGRRSCAESPPDSPVRNIAPATK